MYNENMYTIRVSYGSYLKNKDGETLEIAKMLPATYKGIPVFIFPYKKDNRDHGGSFVTQEFKMFSQSTGEEIKFKDGDEIEL